MGQQKLEERVAVSYHYLGEQILSGILIYLDC